MAQDTSSSIVGHEARGNLSIALMREIGRTMALLHAAARTWPFPVDGDGFREGYCYDERLVQYHRSWIDKYAETIGHEQSTLLHSTVDYMLAVLSTYEKNRHTYGIIHADLHPGNVIVTDEMLAVIDFDQVGRGYFCYDIALLMGELRAEGHYFAAFWESFQAGYQEVAPLPYTSDHILETFALGSDIVFLDAYYNSWTPEGRAKYGSQLPSVYEAIRQRLHQLRARY
jgi:Ser/Thr protein kinase RdoA (MazF antagonist)